MDDHVVHDDDSWMLDRVGAAERGENPTVLARLKTGWAVIGDTQHLPGYCLLLYAGKADQLTDLTHAERVAFLSDLAILGEAVQRTCATSDPAFLRINYEILGNSWPHLHGHVHARYTWEPESLRRGPVWRYGTERNAPGNQLSARHEPLRNSIRTMLEQVAAEAYAG